MADITNLFKATVKTMKTKLKSQGATVNPDKSILPTSRNKGEFATKSKDVVSNIKQLAAFLSENRKDYVNAGSHLGQSTSRMSDADRDRIDADAETYMRLCSESIRALKKQESSSKILAQVREHRESVLMLLSHYLKAVCKVYSEQRAVRVKRVVDRKRIARLEPDKKHGKNTFQSRVAKSEPQNEGTVEGVKDSTEEKKPKTTSHKDHLLSTGGEDFDDLSPEELQMFQQENQQLYHDMNSMVDEVKQIEGKVVEISRLQEIFSEKILEQETDIDRIALTVVGTTENIKEANEDIREAMQNKAGLRVWILFFLIVCSFSLLFLDWYNP